MSASTNLFDGLQKLESRLEEFQGDLAKLRGEALAQKEREEREEKDCDFKPGDWVICTDAEPRLAEGQLYQIESFDLYVHVYGKRGGWYPSRFRHATPAEIKAAQEIKVGDWVVAVEHRWNDDNPIKTGEIYRALRYSEILNAFGLEGIDGSFDRNRFRKATPAEVAAHLKKLEAEKVAAEAKKREEEEAAKEIKVGDKVVLTSAALAFDGTPVLYDVTFRNERSGNLMLEGYAWVESEKVRKATSEEIARAEARVVVTVDGTAYSADYTTTKGCVTFGCAQIDNRMIRRAHELCTTGFAGNRDVIAVQLGRGLFTKDQLATLAANLKD